MTTEYTHNIAVVTTEYSCCYRVLSNEYSRNAEYSWVRISRVQPLVGSHYRYQQVCCLLSSCNTLFSPPAVFALQSQSVVTVFIPLSGMWMAYFSLTYESHKQLTHDLQRNQLSLYHSAEAEDRDTIFFFVEGRQQKLAP